MTSSCFNSASDWHSKMELNRTETRSVLRHFLKIFTEHRKRSSSPCSNYTNPYIEEQEELTASLYILIVIGFFGFLLFSLMISNIVSRRRVNYADFLYNGDPWRNDRIIPQIKKEVIITNKSILPELSKPSQCEKTDSCAAAAKIPSVESVLRNV